MRDQVGPASSGPTPHPRLANLRSLASREDLPCLRVRACIQAPTPWRGRSFRYGWRKAPAVSARVAGHCNIGLAQSGVQHRASVRGRNPSVVGRQVQCGSRARRRFRHEEPLQRTRGEA
jgi:hypothetical protein